MKIVFCASEVVPFAKTGGMADVCGALPLALEKLGDDVVIVMPRYKTVDDNRFSISRVSDDISMTTIGQNIRVYFVENWGYYVRDGLYGDRRGDYPDNLKRFTHLCRRTLELLKQINFQPDIVHCHDWQTALIPVYLKAWYGQDPFYQKTKSVLTLHNLAYQGIFPKSQFSELGLNPHSLDVRDLEFFGQMNLLKAGILWSDALNTVSPTYAEEILRPEHSWRLSDVLHRKKGVLRGILNGIDYDLWDPRKDELITQKYSVKNLQDKYLNKLRLQQELNLEQKENVPLIGFVGRLTPQKGLDLLAQTIDEFGRWDLQMAFLGLGEDRYHWMLQSFSNRYPHKMASRFMLDEGMAHRIYAGIDLFLMPSSYEPCGLSQMISLKYGVIPIVFKTGGLADTIKPYDQAQGNGVVFGFYNRDSILWAMRKALEIYHDQTLRVDLMTRGMKCDYSWNKSAKKYHQMYEDLVPQKKKTKEGLSQE